MAATDRADEADGRINPTPDRASEANGTRVHAPDRASEANGTRVHAPDRASADQRLSNPLNTSVYGADRQI